MRSGARAHELIKGVENGLKHHRPTRQYLNREGLIDGKDDAFSLDGRACAASPPLKDSEPEKLGWKAVERVIPHHLKHDVHEHPTKVNGSNQSQTAPKLLKV